MRCYHFIHNWQLGFANVAETLSQDMIPTQFSDGKKREALLTAFANLIATTPKSELTDAPESRAIIHRIFTPVENGGIGFADPDLDLPGAADCLGITGSSPRDIEPLPLPSGLGTLLITPGSLGLG